VLSGEGVPLNFSGLYEFKSKEDLTKLMKDLGLRDIAVDVPLYLPTGEERWREEERTLRQLGIRAYSPTGKNMLPLHSWAKDLLEIEGVREEGFALGFGGISKIFEVYPNASFTILAEGMKMASLASKRTIKGISQRLEILMRFVKSPDDWHDLMNLDCGVDDALDAVVAALTHFLIETGRARRLGKCLWVPATSPPEGSSSP